MGMHVKYIRGLLWITLAMGAVALAGCEHNHDPWVKPAGTMQAQRNVGVHQQQQLATRQWIGQSDR